MENLIEQLKLQIIEQLNLLEVDPKSIQADDPLFGQKGLGLDSVDALEIVVLLEQNYGIEVTDVYAMADHFASLKTLAEFVAKHKEDAVNA